ncbi:hypothetical protein J6590_104988 [Homalodisca vitripennis]|nr:hypothetical protein J6590_104988 [Homalodisca vitripennis]
MANFQWAFYSFFSVPDLVPSAEKKARLVTKYGKPSDQFLRVFQIFSPKVAINQRGSPSLFDSPEDAAGPGGGGPGTCSGESGFIGSLDPEEDNYTRIRAERVVSEYAWMPEATVRPSP